MRDGVPLPELTPAEVLSQLTHRVFGPLRRDRVRAVLDYHGLAGRPADTQAVVAARRGVTSRTIYAWVAAVAAAGTHVPLSSEIMGEANRPSTPTEDHRGAGADRGRPRRHDAAGTTAAAATGGGVPSHAAAARVATRVVAAAGPLDLESLLAAVTRHRRFRHRQPIAAAQLEVALTVAGATADAGGRWHAPTGVVAPDRYRAIATAAGGRDLTRRDMIDVLIAAAGYTPKSAGGLISTSHPLFRHIGPDPYRLISEGERGADPPSAQIAPPPRAASDPAPQTTPQTTSLTDESQ